MDALVRLLTKKEASCAFYDIITDAPMVEPESPAGNSGAEPQQPEGEFMYSDNLNESQVAAVNSCKSRLSLIWGPPGNFHAHCDVHILTLCRDGKDHSCCSNSASIHRQCEASQNSHDGLHPQWSVNMLLVFRLKHLQDLSAVDNVLERFIKINREERLLSNEEEQLLRVATDQSKVNKALRNYTIDARVGGDVNENSKLLKKAKERVERAVIIFTTCAGETYAIIP